MREVKVSEELDAVNLQALDRLVQPCLFFKLSRKIGTTAEFINDKNVACVLLYGTGDESLIADIIDVGYFSSQFLQEVAHFVHEILHRVFVALGVENHRGAVVAHHCLSHSFSY